MMIMMMMMIVMMVVMDEGDGDNDGFKLTKCLQYFMYFCMYYI